MAAAVLMSFADEHRISTLLCLSQLSCFCNAIKLSLEDTSNGCPFYQHHVWSLCLIGHRRSQMFFQGMSVMFVVCW